MKFTILTTVAILAILGMLGLARTPREAIHIANQASAMATTPTVVRTVEAYVTAYSSEDSCHYPKDGYCLTASGWYASHGIVACSKKFDMGTRVLIEGRIYQCEDRYATYLDRMRTLPTFDIWMGYGRLAHEQARQFGIKKIEVGILK